MPLSLFLVVFFYAFSGLVIAENTVPAVATNASSKTTSLLTQYIQLKDALEQSLFDSPILLNNDISDEHAQGEAYVVLEIPFPALKLALSQPAQWCKLAILHTHIKACTYQQEQLTFFVGDKQYQSPDEAFALQYTFENLSPNDQHLNIKLSAANGPFDTSNYLIRLEAIATDAQHSFMRFTYRYHFGFMANMAVQTYLATLGRNKVGFTVTGKDEQGQSIYINGLQGMLERNVMRYIFAIKATLKTQNFAKESRYTERLTRWYNYAQQYPQQMGELSRKEYITNKEHEIRNQLTMQKRLMQ